MIEIPSNVAFENVVYEIAFVSIFLLCVAHALTRGSLVRLVCGLFYGLTIEWLVYEGVEKAGIERLYDHGRFVMTLPDGSGTPIYIILLWAVFLYVCDEGARQIGGSRVLVAGLLAVSLDTTLEPIAQRLGMWVYRLDLTADVAVREGDKLGQLGATWNGAPLVNLIAWFVLQSAFTLACQMTDSGRSSAAVRFVVRYVASVLLCLFGFGLMTIVRPPYTPLDDRTLFPMLVSILSFATVAWRRRETQPIDLQLVFIVICWHTFSLVSLFIFAPENEGKPCDSDDERIGLVWCALISTALFVLPSLGGGGRDTVKQTLSRATTGSRKQKRS